MLVSYAPSPTPAELAVLSRVERATFAIADVMARVPPAAGHANDVFMSGLIGVCGGRRVDVEGVHHIAPVPKTHSILLVANHRSFFDLYVTMAVLRWHAGFRGRRALFPVRSTFFYDHALGPVVNLVMSGMRMFPPMMREREKAAFNRYSLDRCVAELDVPGTIVGLHPEGMRNKGPDPYALLPAQPGVGRVALGARHARVFPVFVLGMSNSVGREFVLNWTAPSLHRIRVDFGPEIDLADLRAGPSRAATQLRAAKRCRDAILALAARDQSLHGPAPGARPAGAPSPITSPFLQAAPAANAANGRDASRV
jgi:1-acyl-sn-glycerol-3-phosphate acyltransferase